MDAYDGAIAYVDDHIGWLITELQNRGLAKNTLIVITSDHGESFAEHGLFGHFNNLYREEIHVPLILWQPGQVPAGIRISRPVTNAALPSTIMDLMGENTQTLFLRPSLAQLWKDPQAYPNPSYPLIELERNPWTSRNAPAYHGPMKSLVSSKWQYIEHEKLGTELYDWDNDPKEKYNLASSPEGRRVIDGLKEQLQKMVGIAPLQK